MDDDLSGRASARVQLAGNMIRRPIAASWQARCLLRAPMLLFLAMGLVLAAVPTADAAYDDEPAIKLATAQLVSPSEVTFESLYSGTSASTHTIGIAASPERAPELKALSRALGANQVSDDVYTARVSEYVRHNIEPEFRFGLAKGARGAAIDQSGTPFDQAHLMVELLREGGVPSVSYRIGTISLNATQFGKWTTLVYNLNESAQTFSVNAKAACMLLADGGIPATVNGLSSCSSVSGALSTVTMMHVWVAANGKLYDPSYKPHVMRGGIDVVAAMGCGTESSPTCGAAVESAALQGAIQSTMSGAPSIADLNDALVRSTISTFAVNLQEAVQAADRFAPLENIVGGAVIDATYAPTATSTLPYTSSQYESWSADDGIPDQYRTKLRIQFLGIDVGNLYTDELYGQRLRIATLGPNDSWTRTSSLYLEGRELARASYLSDINTNDDVRVDIDHPYAADGSGSTSLTKTYGDEQLSLYVSVRPSP